MNIQSSLEGFLSEKNRNKNVFKLLATVIIIAGIFIVLNMLFPSVVALILNVLWVLILSIVLVFFGLGLLVILGMKKDVNRILDILLEGSLTLIDFVNFIRELWARFKRLLREFLIYAAPIFASIFAGIIYIGLLVLYKSVGQKFDVTLITILITLVLVILVETLNRKRIEHQETTWTKLFKERFMNTFADAFEVIIFIFFLTMDSTKLFFLPDHLNIPLRAQILDYDFMVRGFAFNDHLKITATFIMVAVSSEIIRFALKLISISTEIYKQTVSYMPYDQNATIRSKTNIIKDSVRRGFISSKNDTVKFITFNTVLILVFLLFPRLKLLGMVTASITSLLVALIIPKKKVSTSQNDLFARILAKIFNL